MLSEEEKQILYEKLDADGEDKVLEDLAQNVYGETKKPLVMAWLRQRERKRADELVGRFIAAMEKLSQPLRRGVFQGVLQGVVIALICWAGAMTYSTITSNFETTKTRLLHGLLSVSEHYVGGTYLSALNYKEQLELAKDLVQAYDSESRRYVIESRRFNFYGSARGNDMLLARIADVQMEERHVKVLWTILKIMPIGIVFFGILWWKRRNEIEAR